jgi:hypothetical protein
VTVWVCVFELVCVCSGVRAQAVGWDMGAGEGLDWTG